MNADDFNEFTNRFPLTDTMPVLFVGHGNPMNAIEENEFTRGWVNAAALIPKPAAILAVSAHWETRGTQVTINEHPRTIHDFGGFPQELFNVQYPAPGSPLLAEEVINVLSSKTVLPSENWGIDHGTWSVIKHFYPNADIPIIQLSLDYSLNPAGHYELARELFRLRNRGVLIVGSGNIVHNLRLVAWHRINEPGYAYDWAIEADNKIKELVARHDHKAIIAYESLGKSVQLAVPTPEHFLPLLYTLALRQENDPVEIFNNMAVAGSLTMTSFKIG